MKTAARPRNKSRFVFFALVTAAASAFAVFSDAPQTATSASPKATPTPEVQSGAFPNTATITGINSASTGWGLEGVGQSGSGIGVRGIASSGSSYAVFGGATSTDAGNPSFGIFGVSSNGYGVYALTTMNGTASLFASNTNPLGPGLQSTAEDNAIVATSSSSNGVFGSSGAPTGSGIYGTNTSLTGAGVYGTSSFVGPGVYGTSTNRQGAVGVLGQGYDGIFGTSTGPTGSAGVYAQYAGSAEDSYALYATNEAFGAFGAYILTTGGADIALHAETGSTQGNSVAVDGICHGQICNGVEGENDGASGGSGATGTSHPPNSFGLSGFSDGSGSTGVWGEGQSYGVYGIGASTSGISSTGVFGLGGSGCCSGIGVYGIGTDISGIGVGGQTDYGTGVFAYATSSSGTPLLVQSSGSGPLMRANNSTQDVFSLDSAGNETIAGSLYVTGTIYSGGGVQSCSPCPQPLLSTKSSTGTDLGAYEAKQAVPTIEDLGESQLVNGEAYVRLDPRFASTIDPNDVYLVFVTPGGDTNGLYVTHKTLDGFVVRETHGGRSAISFDYRIVAKPLGSTMIRLPAIGQSSGAHQISRMSPAFAKMRASRGIRPPQFIMPRRPISTFIPNTSSRPVSTRVPLIRRGYIPKPLRVPSIPTQHH